MGNVASVILIYRNLHEIPIIVIVCNPSHFVFELFEFSVHFLFA